MTNSKFVLKYFVLGFFLLWAKLDFAQRYKYLVFVDGKLEKKKRHRFDTIYIQQLISEEIKTLAGKNYLDTQLDSLVYGEKIKIFIKKAVKTNVFLKIDIDSLLKPYNELFRDTNLLNIRQYCDQNLRELQNTGYPFAGYNMLSENLGDSLSVNVQFKNLKYFTIQSLKVNQPEVNIKILEDYLGLKPGEAFSLKKWQNVQQKLNNDPYFEKIKPLQTEASEKGMDLYFYLKKKKSSNINGLLAFNYADKKLLWYGNILVDLNNIFNHLEHIRLRWESLPENQKKADLSFSIPYIMQTPFFVDGYLQFYQQDSSFLRFSDKLYLNYKINEYWQTGLFTEHFTSISNYLEQQKINYRLNGFKIENLYLSAQFNYKFSFSFSYSKNNEMERKKYFSELNLEYKWQKLRLKSSSEFNFSDYNILNISELELLGGLHSVVGYEPNTLRAKDFYNQHFSTEYSLNENWKFLFLSDFLYFNNEKMDWNFTFGQGFGFVIKRKNTAWQLVVGFPEKKIEQSNLNFKLINYF